MSRAGVLAHDWYPAALPANVELGEGSWLYSAFSFLHYRSTRPSGLRVGRCTGIYNGSFFELGPDAEVSVGDYCTLVGAIFATDGCVRIGDYCFVAHEVVFGDSAFAVPGGTAPASGRGTNTGVPFIELGNDVWVGAGAIILAGARIGDGAIIGAAAVVDFEVPAYGIVGGNPGRVVGFARPDAAQMHPL